MLSSSDPASRSFPRGCPRIHRRHGPALPPRARPDRGRAAPPPRRTRVGARVPPRPAARAVTAAQPAGGHGRRRGRRGDRPRARARRLPPPAHAAPGAAQGVRRRTRRRARRDHRAVARRPPRLAGRPAGVRAARRAGPRQAPLRVPGEPVARCTGRRAARCTDRARPTAPTSAGARRRGPRRRHRRRPHPRERPLATTSPRCAAPRDIARTLRLSGEDEEVRDEQPSLSGISSPDLLRLDPVIRPVGPPPGLEPPRRRPKAYEPAPPTTDGTQRRACPTRYQGRSRTRPARHRRGAADRHGAGLPRRPLDQQRPQRRDRRLLARPGAARCSASPTSIRSARTARRTPIT